MRPWLQVLLKYQSANCSVPSLSVGSFAGRCCADSMMPLVRFAPDAARALNQVCELRAAHAGVAGWLQVPAANSSALNRPLGRPR